MLFLFPGIEIKFQSTPSLPLLKEEAYGKMKFLKNIRFWENVTKKFNLIKTPSVVSTGRSIWHAMTSAFLSRSPYLSPPPTSSLFLLHRNSFYFPLRSQ